MKLLIWLLPVVLLGCATARPRPQPLLQADVVALAKAGVADEEIIRRIDESWSVYRLRTADVVRLRQQGLSDRVVDFMLETYIRYAVAEQRRRDLDDYEWHYRFGYWHGPGWWRW